MGNISYGTEPAPLQGHHGAHEIGLSRIAAWQAHMALDSTVVRWDHHHYVCHSHIPSPCHQHNMHALAQHICYHPHWCVIHGEAVNDATRMPETVGLFAESFCSRPTQTNRRVKLGFGLRAWHVKFMFKIRVSILASGVRFKVAVMLIVTLG